ncbi:hypothetical protein EV361DRAFT_505639 [Lentinula raphanica]|nr:hypothetical protein F5880DRAFT_980237 [Lentinula raphanica]KAJ3967288.1 hypothetical protein EV361DRAFT_505639 [Lentinula raphanica]
MRWFAPPTRRELTLLLFCSTVFTLAYNFENSLRFVGFDAYPSRRALLTRFGFQPTNSLLGTLLKDGKKAEEWRDDLDDTIIWNDEENPMHPQWKDSDVDYGSIEQGQALGVGPHSAMWISQAKLERLWPNRLAEKSVREGFWRWNDDVPTTKFVRHLPGYTVLDQLIIFKNYIYIVTDDPQLFPAVGSISATMADKLQVVSTQHARDVLGRYGGRIHGVSWMCTEPTPQDTTLLSLWSMYSSLSNSSSSDSSFAKPSLPSSWPDLPSPARLILPLTPTFSDPDNDENWNKKPNFPFNYAEKDILPPDAPPRPPVIPRPRSNIGIHPLLLKVALPHMPGVWYQEEWNDYMGMEVPYVLERVVIGDHSVGGIEALLQQHSQQGSKDWLEPIRQNVVSFFRDPRVPNQDDSSRKRSLTYVQRHGSLVSEDHNALVRALNKMGRDRGIEVNLVDAGSYDELVSTKVNKDDIEWGDRMGAIIRSDILIACQGSDFLEGIFLRPSSPASTSIMVEIFAPTSPNSIFAGAREHDVIAKSLGMRYIPWAQNRRLSSDEIASSRTSLAADHAHDVPVDANSIVQYLNDILDASADV